MFNILVLETGKLCLCFYYCFHLVVSVQTTVLYVISSVPIQYTDFRTHTGVMMRGNDILLINDVTKHLWHCRNVEQGDVRQQRMYVRLYNSTVFLVQFSSTKDMKLQLLVMVKIDSNFIASG